MIVFTVCCHWAWTRTIHRLTRAVPHIVPILPPEKVPKNPLCEFVFSFLLHSWSDGQESFAGARRAEKQSVLYVVWNDITPPANSTSPSSVRLKKSSESQKYLLHARCDSSSSPVKKRSTARRMKTPIYKEESSSESTSPVQEDSYEPPSSFRTRRVPADSTQNDENRFVLWCVCWIVASQILNYNL